MVEDKPLQSTRLDDDAKIELERLAKSSKYTQQFIASHAIMQVAPMGMLAPDWDIHIKELEDVRTNANRYAGLDDPCTALCFIDDHYECRWGRDEKPPEIKRIGKTIEAVKEGCASCKNTLDLKERLITAEAKLAKGIVTHLPSCKMGGRLSPDGKSLYCKNPKMLAQYRDVNKWCKVVRNKANCENLTWTIIKIQGKQFELDEKSV